MLVEVIRTTYVAPARYDPNTYYDLESLRKFEASTVPLTFISDGEFKSDFFWIENGTLGELYIKITTLNGWSCCA
jgi:hypothetical protein